ncbi:unnamed protein product [Aphanomyces euteiches]|nr:hypothetical protein AeRB84_002670 [Aphanomyces euteiches]
MRVSISLALAASAVVVYSQGLRNSPVDLPQEQATVDSEGEGLRLLQGEALDATDNLPSRRLAGMQTIGCVTGAWCRLSARVKVVQRLKSAPVHTITPQMNDNLLKSRARRREHLGKLTNNM